MGSSSVDSVTFPSNYTSTTKIKIYGDEVWVGDFSGGCAGTVGTWNVTDGTTIPYRHTDALNRCGGQNPQYGFVQNQWGEPTILLYHYTYSFAICGDRCADMEVTNSTHVISDQATNCGNSGASTGTFTYTWMDVDTTSGSCNLDKEVDFQHNLDGNIPSKHKICGETGCYGQLYTFDVGNTGSISNSIPVGTSGWWFSPTIDQFYQGRFIPGGEYIANSTTPFYMTHGMNDPGRTLFKEWFAEDKLNDEFYRTMMTHYKILDNSETSVPGFSVYDDGVNRYIIQWDASQSLYATNNVDWSNKAYEFYVNDDYTGASTYVSRLESSGALSHNLFIQTPTTTYSSVATAGAYVLPSGYELSLDSGATLREVHPKFTNTESLRYWFPGLTTGLTSLSVDIKNTPPDFAVAFYDTLSIDGQNYLWATIPLTADGSVTVDLPTGECVSLVGHETDTTALISTNFGQLCASGTMPKELVYSQNLAFTFWTLPFGASHVYETDTETLNTKVRSEVAPFEYTVNVSHANGTIYNSTLYSGVTTNSTTFDLRQLDITNVTKPGKLEIYDGNNKLVYYATIGVPSYFSGVASFFAQELTIEGFNILYMLPIIFAAMFTRNTVGIGTALTVASIALLSWLGLIVIEETIIYLLVFIAVIGMIAYRKLIN